MPKPVRRNYQLFNEDCFVTFQRIPDKSVDLVLCDPPYGITESKWDSVIPLDHMWLEIVRIIKPHTPVIFTCTQPFTSILVMSQPRLYHHEWIWEKSKITGVLNAKKQPVRQHENVLVFGSRPNYYPQGLVPIPKPTRQGSSSKNYKERGKYGYTQLLTGYPRTVLKIPSEGKTQHPTQKPIALMEYLIKTYSVEDDIVLDFAMGSGTTGVAALKTGRKFIGCDNDTREGYFQLAQRRIKEVSHED